MRKLFSIYCELYFRIASFYLAQQARHEADALTAVERQNPEALVRIETQRQSSEKLLIRRLLQRYPYWTKGHARLGELGLKDKEIPLAYASAQAMIALEGPRSAGGRFLLARSYLGGGDSAQALPILEKLSAESTGAFHYRVLEELAAALVLAGEYQKAHALLTNVPESVLSPEARAAQKFLRTKV